MRNANAVKKIRAVFVDKQKPLTLKEIKLYTDDLLPNEISMALCYLLKQRYVSRETVKNDMPKERKSVWKYTYSETKMELKGNQNEHDKEIHGGNSQQIC